MKNKFTLKVGVYEKEEWRNLKVVSVKEGENGLEAWMYYTTKGSGCGSFGMWGKYLEKFMKGYVLRKPKITATRNVNQKDYVFIFEDVDGNEIERKPYRGYWFNIKEARIHAKNLLGSISDDTNKIIVKRI
jgi:hypothetical protein